MCGPSTAATTRRIATRSERSSLFSLSLSVRLSFLSLSFFLSQHHRQRSSSRSSTSPFAPATRETTKKDFLARASHASCCLLSCHRRRQRRRSSWAPRRRDDMSPRVIPRVTLASASRFHDSSSFYQETPPNRSFVGRSCMRHLHKLFS